MLLRLLNKWNWKTGAPNNAKSSQISAIEKINNNRCEWENPLPNAMYLQATTADEIFDCSYASTDWGRNELKNCRDITNHVWSDNKKEGTW